MRASPRLHSRSERVANHAMPIACPACGRPNADRAAQCVYCTESLEGLRSEPTLDAAADPTAASPDRHLIILAPQSLGDDGGAEARVALFAEAAGLSAYDARLALSTERPRVLRRLETAAQAESWSARLQAAGVVHFRVAESELLSLSVVAIRNMDLLGDAIQLGLAEGKLMVIAYRDLFFLVQGEIVRQRHRERLLGTIQGAHRVLTPGQRLHFYARGTTTVAELDPEQFDWAVLGDRRTPSTPINFRLLVDEILTRAPEAVLDRGFGWEPVVLSRAEQEDDSGLGAALSGEGGSREATVYDNAAQFRFYSRWRYLTSLRSPAPTG